MGENQAATSGNGASAATGGHLLAPSESGSQDVLRALQWLVSSLPSFFCDWRGPWREVLLSSERCRATLTPVQCGSAGVTLVNDQSPRVALFYASTGAVVRAVARIDLPLVRGPAGVKALLRATRINLTEVVRELLIAGVDPNKSNVHDSSSFSPVHTAALKGHVGSLKILTEHRANVNARLPHGGTPLHFATMHGHTECLAVLIARGGDVNAACAHGLTPLHVAVLSGFADCVALLMANAANSKLRDARGHEPICYAVEKEDIIIESTIVSLQGHYTSSNTPVLQNGYPTCDHNMARIYEACSWVDYDIVDDD